jgi:phosphoadenosine phosphosulfate reductase
MNTTTIRETPDTVRTARSLIQGAARLHGEGLVMSTSFGIQSAAHRFAAELEERLELDLHIASASLSPARMEALHGRLWEQGDVAALDRYDRIRKVEPMQEGLDELDATAWIAGLRSDQTEHRKSLPVVGEQWGRTKYLPILDWTSRDLHRYLEAHGLPYHPLFYEGFSSVGDWHTSRAMAAGDENERDTRFLGLKQECGIHLA